MNSDVAQSGIDPLGHYLVQGWLDGRDPHPLFDTNWYLNQNPNLAASGKNPLLHYLVHGWKEARTPHPLFDPNWYLRQNPDVAASGANPLIHYVRQGWREGRNPHPLFDTAFYLKRNPDVAKTGAEPLSHYVLQGGLERRDPHPLFDSNWYLSQDPDVSRSGAIPLIHYLHSGKLKSPHPLFDAEYYVERRLDAAASGMNPLMHFVIFGAARRYNPHPLFDLEFYLNQRPFTEADIANPLRHYISQGAWEGLDPCELFDSSFYLEQYPEVREAGLNPLAHFWAKGAMNGYKPNPLFDTFFYLRQYPTIAIARVNPLVDFVDHGAIEGRFPNPFFDPLFYLRNNPDVKIAGRNPLAHYLTSGAKEGRDPGPSFNTASYVSEHPDLNASDINPLAHFLEHSKQVSSKQTLSFPAAAVLLPTGMSDHCLPELPNCRSVSPCKSIAAVNDAFRNASEAGCHLLIVLGPLMPDKEAVNRLIESFSLDPHFGAAIPRQSHPLTGEILKLSDEQGDPDIATLPAQVLTEIPKHYILPEIVSSCFVLRDLVISNLGCLDETYETLAGALQQYLCRARRCGLRCIVVNDAVVPAAPDNSSWLVTVSGRDLVKLQTEYLDIGDAKLQFKNHPLHRHESLLARAFSPKQSVRQSLLVDTTGIPTQVNGTTEAVLGLCDGLRQLDSGWTITLLATPDAAKYHRLSERYPDWDIIGEESSRFFTVALRPSQPWNLSSIIKLHRRALFNLYSILDTIAWDILFVAPPGLEPTWNFLSSYADGILYISEYTRHRFTVRFPLATKTPGYVSYLSLDPDDYRYRQNSTIEENVILVVGNRYDHKNVEPTVDLLISRFPSHRIRALGLRTHASPFVECLESGQIHQADIDRLFAQATIIVFPSFYEGFGFPVLKGLSNGCTVIARRSELLLEIAGRYRGPGRLIGFSNPTELIEAVDRVIHGSELAELPLGTALSGGEEPNDWKDVASGTLRFIEEQVQNVDRSRWCARQRAIEQIEAHSG